jgi:hypothetical protein
MGRIGIEVHCAVDAHGKPYDRNAGEDHRLRRDHSALQKLRRNGRRKSDRECAGSENPARINGAISIQRLQLLRSGFRRLHRLYSTFTVWVATGLAVPGLILLIYRKVPVSIYIIAVAAAYPLLYYVVVSDVRYRYPLLWLSLLCAGYLLSDLAGTLCRF